MAGISDRKTKTLKIDLKEFDNSMIGLLTRRPYNGILVYIKREAHLDE